jgi:xanthine dehydrogenase accessory factor
MTSEPIPEFSGRVMMIEVIETRGSTPRETGAFMLVGPGWLWGTVGGGNMEFAAIEKARSMLNQPGTGEVLLDITLGPDSGQCCGGRVKLRIAIFDDSERGALEKRLREKENLYPDVYLFGAGHVGRALAQALKPLPVRVTVIESRADELANLDEQILHRLVAMPEAEVAQIRPGGAAVILTHDHALDFLIGAEALKRSDLVYTGMIGSKTKRAVFASWLREAGVDTSTVDRLVLPIGGTAVRDKRPEVIAALVAAELMTVFLRT